MYKVLLRDIQNKGKEFAEVKEELDTIYKTKAQKKLDQIKRRNIHNQMYDIHTLQQQRKFENQGKIREIKINDKIFEGTEEVVRGIQEEMERELRQHGAKGLDDLSSSEEDDFLENIEEVIWTEQDIERLNELTKEEEVFKILKEETNLDSAPGEDGITARFMLFLWNIESYRWLYLKFLNFSRFPKNYYSRNNVGVMVVKNKKS